MKPNSTYNLIFFLLISFTFQTCKKSSKAPDPVPTTVVNNQLPPENNKGVGGSAKDLLLASKPKLVVEIHYMKGFALETASVDNLKTFLQTYLNKPGGIQVVQSEIPAVATNPLSLADVIQLEKNYRTVFTTSDQVAIHFLITNSSYTSSGVLGIAYLNTSLCLFGKTIHDNTGGVGQASRVKVESSVLNHEVGHILGLTNLGTPMVTKHNDDAHTDHCNNSNCLMYFSTETTDVLGILLTGNIAGLDQNCINDLKENGGK
ncbi:MAG: hypothetical protein H7329_01380 [Opitutaceae bacterium]|nr:hypothetical protein [Cytophagales bacterium]